MAEEYKLTYFNIRGLAEPIRLLLVDNDIQFTDDQFTSDQWPTLKNEMPLGQAPVLYHEGIPLAQSGAILRHLARKHNLYGSNLNQSAFIDMMYESVIDARKRYYDYMYRDAESKEDCIKNVKIELAKIESLGTKNPSFPKLTAGHYITGDKPSYVDYVYFEFLDALVVTLDAHILEGLSATKAYFDLMAHRPNMSKYLASDKRKNMKISGSAKEK
nr:glutathione S-transferase sigma 1 [Diamesa zernyi]